MSSLPRHLRLTFSLILALFIVCLINYSIVAQTRKTDSKARPQTPVRTDPSPSREPDVQLTPITEDPAVAVADVAITARVKARELRFDVVPNPSVEFPCKPNCETSWEAERENLPTPVQPGVTYRNIGIRLKITSVFSDIDRIVAEALGEIPLTEVSLTADVKTTGTDESTKPSNPGNTARPESQAATPLRLRKQR